LLKQFHGYYDPSGQRETISEELRNLIGEVYLEAREKEKVTREIFENQYSNPASITWFATSSIEPRTFGMTEFKTGALIGLPYFYNYRTYDDVPDEALEIKKLKLFRNPFKRLKKQDEDPKEDDLAKKIASKEAGPNQSGRPELILVRKYDRNSDLGRQLMDTLVLSDDAKRFSVARELFIADSYKVPYTLFDICFCCILGNSVGALSVKFFNVLKAPIGTRIPYYLLSAFYGYGMYKITSEEIEKRTLVKAKTRAKQLGENYVKGADEYFEKCKRRREILTQIEPEVY